MAASQRDTRETLTLRWLVVSIEFRPDPRVIEENRKLDPGTADAAVLQETFFVMPLRLRVRDVELLEWQGEGFPLPLLDMATVGLSTARRLGHGATTSLRLPANGNLYFERSGEDVLIRSTQTRRAERAPYEDLLRAWEEFATKVREFLVREFPQLEDHPY